MATKKEVSSLLRKSTFSGLEAAQLIIGHHVEQDQDRPGFLSEREISYIKSRLTPSAAIEYNRWIDTYRIIDRTLQEARVLALEIILAVVRASRELERYFIDEIIQLCLRFQPAIVTEKQYKDIKANQRARLLQEYQCLDAVICKRAYELAPQELQEAADDHTEIAEEYPELYQKAERQIQELIEAGRLQPVKLKHKASDKEAPENIDGWYREDDSWSEQDKDRLLQTYIIVNELYKASLPEWTEWVDEFKPGLTEEEANAYALIQPESTEIGYTIDKQGYYQSRFEGLLGRISGVQAMEEEWKSRGFSGAEEVHQGVNRKIRSQLSGYLGLQSIVEAVSDTLSVDFAEDLREWYGQIEQYVDDYNEDIRPDSPFAKDLPKLRKLRIDNLKPSTSSLRYFRERIALGLGEGWQEAAKDLVAFVDDEELEEVGSGQEA